MANKYRKVYKPAYPFLILAIIFFVAGFFTLISFNARAIAPTIFSDGFESDNFSNWTSADSKWGTTSGGATDEHSGEARADVKGNTSGEDVLLKNISTAGHENLTLNFWRKIKSALEEDDHVYVEWTANGSDWNELTDFSDVGADTEWVEADYNLPEGADNNENFGLRFRAVLNAGNDEFYLDDVFLSGNVMSEESPTPTPVPVGGVISGYKFEDLNGNGQRDDGEPTLNGWTIWLNGDEYAITGDEEKGWADGYYEFTNLDGEYTVCEELRDDWSQTYPNNNTDDTNNYDIYNECDDYEQEFPRYGYEVEIDEDRAENLNFGNFQYGYISGHKYAKETGDPIENRRIYLLRPNGESDSMYTTSEGEYRFENLGPGEYQVCEQMDDENDEVCAVHSDQTFPEGFYTIQMTSNGKGLDNPNYDFKNVTLGRVKVSKFKDLNRSGSRDEGEPTLKGWKMHLYRIDGGEEEGGGSGLDMGVKETDKTGWAVWEGLDLGIYRVVEEDRAGWTHITDSSFEEELHEENLTAEFRFGNQPNEIRAVKFHDKNSNQERDENEPLLSGWNFCLYKVVFSGEEDGGQINELVSPCQMTNNEGEVFWTELEVGDYALDEEEREHWFHTTANDGEVFYLEGGMATYYFGNNTTSITAHKYYDINQNEEQDFWAEDLLEPNLRSWNMCLYRLMLSGEEEGIEAELVRESCRLTDDDGLALWIGLEPGLYRVIEEEREGWNEVTGTERTFELERGDAARADFGNWIEDQNPPVSSFDSDRDHEVIDTEMVSLELTGRSLDQESGVKEAVMSIFRLGGPESIQNYPAQSFFDVFTELKCPIEPRREEPLIPIEIVALSLTSVDPITVSWGHNWTPPSTGTYCFEVKATDYANRPENTAWAGPLAYVPVAQVSSENVRDITETSFTVEWHTDKMSTSRVIYDTVSHSSLGEAPNYGYAFSTPEEDTDPKVEDHLVIIGGVTAGTTYFYRTISAASPETVGGENSVTTATPPGPSSNGGGNGGGGGGGITGEFINGPLANSNQMTGVSTGFGQVLGESVCKPLLNGYIFFGRKNNLAEVKKLQQFLNDYQKADLPVTGFYGKLSRSAVKVFQLKHWQEILSPWVPFGLANGQTATGNVSKTTRHKINKLICPTFNESSPRLP